MPSPTREERAGSFGSVAEEYDRWRPGPPQEALDWLLPAGAETVVDLAAGTGSLTRRLLERVPTVYSVEPDARMRTVLARRAPTAIVLEGKGEAIPIADALADAVLVSSAWHWMDVEPTLIEIARVLHERGVLGVIWSGPDRSIGLIRDLMLRFRQTGPREMAASAGELIGGVVAGGRPESAPVLAGNAGGDTADVAAGDRTDANNPGGDTADVAAGDPTEREPARERHSFYLPPGLPFTEPEFREIRWTRAMTVDEIAGLAGTYSQVITLPGDDRQRLLEIARAWLRRQPELVEGGTTEVPFRAACWRTRRT